MTEKKVFPSDLMNWLHENVGFENFKSGRERLDNAYSSILKKIKNSKTKIVTVAGTNGKGETCWKLSQALYEDGYKVALWTSPHVDSVCERFWKNGSNPTELSLFELFKKTSTQDLTFYEFLFLCFLEWSFSEDIDVLILEVGLGGRLDATNLLDANICAVTSIGRDHQEVLGDKLEDILMEKLGVSRPNRPIISGVTQKFLKEKIEKFAKRQESKVLDIDYVISDCALEVYPERNSAVAQLLYTFVKKNSFLKIHKELFSPRFQEIKAPNRFEEVTLKDNTFIFIGAHNLDGIRETIKLLDYKNYQNLGLLMGFSKRKISDVKAMLKSALKYPCLFNELCVFDYTHPRSLPREELKQLLENIDTDESNIALTFNKEIQDLPKFFDSLKTVQSQPKKFIVCGSYYFIGEFKKFIS
tara:strand:- start:35995 stop:37239 length:1245 start_codon:yes stop_codon:yes gene_type:complete